MKLTDKQNNFALEYIKTFNGVDAYRIAYNKPDMKDSVAAANASRLLKNVNIQKIIKDHQKETAKTVQVTRESLLNDLKTLQDTYQGEGLKASQAVLKSIELQGKIIGAFTENINHTGEIKIIDDIEAE